MNTVGACARCGMPFSQYSGPWFGVTPPPIYRNCNCFSGNTFTTTNTTAPVPAWATRNTGGIP